MSEPAADVVPGPRLVRRRIQLIVEYWEEPEAIAAADLAAPITYLEAPELQLYRVLHVGAGNPQPVPYRPYELHYRGWPVDEQGSGRRTWEVYDPTPGSGRDPLFKGSHAECAAWVDEQGGTVVAR